MRLSAGLEDLAQDQGVLGGKVDEQLGLPVGHPGCVVEDEQELHLPGQMVELRGKPLCLRGGAARGRIAVQRNHLDIAHQGGVVAMPVNIRKIVQSSW